MTNRIIDYISGQEIFASPEEIYATQVFSKRLVEDYGYPKELIQTRPQYKVRSHPSDPNGYPVDIAVFEKDKHSQKFLKIIVECKQPSRNDGLNQLKHYLKFSTALIGVWFNGKESIYLQKNERSGEITFDEIPNIPSFNQTVDEMGLYRRRDLKQTHNLKSVFQELRGYIAGNSVGISRDEIIAKEMINLILCKIYDERFTKPDDMVTFRATEKEDISRVKKRIDGLFIKVKAKYNDVLDQNENIEFDEKTLKYIVSKLQQYCFIDTDRDTISDAFEVFIGSSLKGEQGQFFTPKNVIRALVEAVDPQLGNNIIDPSSGSCGFLVESLKYLWAKIDIEAEKYGWNDIATTEEKKAVAIKNIKGIEKDSFLTKIGKSYMAIIGDGKGGIFCEDSLEQPQNWNDQTRSQIHLGSFDVSFSNPPFGKEIKVTGNAKLSQFELARKYDSKGNFKLTKEANVSSIFYERNMQLLKDGGILGIILPETYFHAPKQSVVRKNFYGHNIKYIIDLPHNTFRPHNNAKCIMIVIQKNRPQQEFINMAVAEYCGHDHNGNPIFEDPRAPIHERVIKDDMPKIINEIRQTRIDSSFKGQFTFKVSASEVINSDILIPRYFWNDRIVEVLNKAQSRNIQMITMQKLIDEKVIACFDGHGSPSGELKGTGDVPYIRVKDIVNWEVYKDNTALIPRDEYTKLFRANKALLENDILYVRRGSYRIGSVAMLSVYDLTVILTREILVIRILKKKNKYGLSPNYLLYALSHEFTFEQAKNKVFIDTTLPNIASRWKELYIPIYPKEEMEIITAKMDSLVKSRNEKLKIMDEMKRDYEVYNT